MQKRLWFLAGSLGVTAALLYYVFSRPVSFSWENLLVRFKWIYIFLYLSLYLLGLFLRTWRYRWLIKKASGGKTVSWFPLTLVTASRNMLVDLLPARIGGWSYPLLLNRVVGVEISHCLTSFTYAFLFDLLSLAPLLGLGIFWNGLWAESNPLWLGLSALVIFLLAGMLLFFLGPLVKTITPFLQKRFPPNQRVKEGWKERVTQELQSFGDSLVALQQSGSFWSLLGLSLLIRIIKYALLYLMLLAVVEALLGRPLALPFGMILFGLMGSEMAASLPISGLAGIGFYEGFLGTILTGLGIKTIDGISLALTMHVLTQLVDYSLGTGALAILVYRWWDRKNLLLHSGKGETGKTAPSDQ